MKLPVPQQNRLSRTLARVAGKAFLPLAGVFSLFLVGCVTHPTAWEQREESARLAGADALLEKALILVTQESINTNAINLEIAETLRLALHLSPDNTNLLDRAMYCLISRSLFDDAFELSQDYLKRNPESRPIRFAAACCADAAGKTELAAQQCEILYRLDPNDREIEETLIRLYFYSNQGTRALQMIQTAAQRTGDKQSIAMPSKWAVHFITRDRDFARGLECIKLALQQTHHKPSVRSALLTLAGECYFQTKQPDPAIAHFLDGYKLDNSNFQSLQRLTALALTYPDTTNRLQQLIVENEKTNLLLATLLKAVLAQANGEITEASEYLRQAHEINIKDGQSSPESFYLWRIALLDIDKNPQAAVPLLQEAIKAYPRSDQLKNTLAYIWAEQGVQLEEASKLINEVLQTSPNVAAYLDTKGWILFKMKRPYDALQYLLKAAELEKDPVIFDHAGDALEATGMLKEAKEFWQKSYELDPKPEVEAKFKK
jgi:tetratricopeptide (TPR) repeat protein